MILPRCSVTAELTVVADSLVNRVNVSLKISFLCCFIITFRAGISIYSVDLTNVLEQVSLLISPVLTLVALELLPLVDTFDVSLEVGGPLSFKLTLGEWTLVHVALSETVVTLLYLDTRVEHYIHLRLFILHKHQVSENDTD